MAVTKGHGNPKWTREEVILAVELYHSAKGSIPGPSDDRVIKLSAEIRAFPYHAEAARKRSFRNPDGVAFKLQNIRQLATGQGLSNTSKMDKAVWEEFGHDPVATAEASARIRKGLEIEATSSDEEIEDGGDEFPEGRVVTRVHKRIERNKDLRRKVLKKRRQDQSIGCDMCGETGRGIPSQYRESLFEVHHRIPIASRGETKTTLADVALLCAGCHRLLHRAISVNKRWIDVVEARSLIFSNGENRKPGNRKPGLPRFFSEIGKNRD